MVGILARRFCGIDRARRDQLLRRADMNLIFPDWVDAPENIGAFCTTRCGGVSLGPYDDGQGGGGFNLGMHVGDNPQHVQRNRKLLQARLPSDPAWLNQVHGTTVADAAELSGVPDADASIATQPGVVCVVQTADCLPVLFSDITGSVVAAAHAGWRGLAAGVLENTLDKMRSKGAGEVIAWMGPAIGPQHFEVGVEVLAVFASRLPNAAAAFKPVPNKTEKYLADIYLLARMLMANAGVTRVHGGNLCTVSEPNRFFSYRRDHVTGRMASVIWRKET